MLNEKKIRPVNDATIHGALLIRSCEENVSCPHRCLALVAGLCQFEGSAAYNLTIDQDVYAVDANPKRPCVEVVNVLAVVDSEVPCQPAAGFGHSNSCRRQVAIPSWVRVNLTGTTPRLILKTLVPSALIGGRTCPA